MIHSIPQKPITIVVDIGTFRTHVGYSGDQSPKISTYSYIASNALLKSHEIKMMAGNSILKADRTDLEIEHIFENSGKEGFQYNFDKYINFVEALLADNLKLGQNQLSILLTEDVAAKPHEIEKQRRKIGQIMFQELNIKNIAFVKKPTLACFSIGKPTGLVIDSGHAFSRASVVHDGYCVASESVPYGGRTISKLIEHKMEELSSKQFTIPIQHYHESYQDGYIKFHKELQFERIKSKLKIDESEEIEDINKLDYKLPDGEELTLRRDEIYDPFVYYPEFWKINTTSDNAQFSYECSKYVEYRSLASLAATALQKPQCQALGKQILQNILVTGGNSQFHNISSNLKQKMSKYSQGCEFSQYPKSNSCHSWIGGSIVSQMSAFNNFWVSQLEWKEGGVKSSQQSTSVCSGVNMINKKCQ